MRRVEGALPAAAAEAEGCTESGWRDEGRAGVAPSQAWAPSQVAGFLLPLGVGGERKARMTMTPRCEA